MFRQAATGEMSPQDALDATDQQVRAIFDKWRAQGAL
jgi:hypothetical protein